MRRSKTARAADSTERFGARDTLALLLAAYRCFLPFFLVPLIALLAILILNRLLFHI